MTTTMRYNGSRSLESLPVYECSLQTLTPNGCSAFVGVKCQGLDIYFDPEPVLHYDLNGRFVKWSSFNHHMRRSFSHRVLETVKLDAESGGGIKRHVLSAEAADTLVNMAARKLKPVAQALGNGPSALQFAAPNADEVLARIIPLVQQAMQFTDGTARRDTERFNSIYRPVAVLPPDHYNSLVLQATEGCAHNQCVFCTFYRETRFHMKSPDEFREHVQQAIEYHGESLTSRRGIFLEQANALTIPQKRLLEIFQIINESFQFPPENWHSEFPRDGKKRTAASWWLGHARRFDGVYSFVDAFSGVHKSADDYRQLCELNLRRVYLGMETGDADLLRFLNKPTTIADLLQTVQNLKTAGLAVALVILVGAGGRQFYERHVEHTASVLNQMPLGKGDYIFFSPLVNMVGSEYFTRAHQANLEILTPRMVDQQEKAIREQLRFADPNSRPIIARYDIEQFVY